MRMSSLRRSLLPSGNTSMGFRAPQVVKSTLPAVAPTARESSPCALSSEGPSPPLTAGCAGATDARPASEPHAGPTPHSTPAEDVAPDDDSLSFVEPSPPQVVDGGDEELLSAAADSAVPAAAIEDPAAYYMAACAAKPSWTEAAPPVQRTRLGMPPSASPPPETSAAPSVLVPSPTMMPPTPLVALPPAPSAMAMPPTPLPTPLPTAPPAPPPAVAEDFFGLPPSARRIYATRGVGRLYEWQCHVLSRQDVASGANFVYSLPTSGGKTLVAEVLLMRAVLRRGGCAIFVLPFVSIAEEKCTGLQAFGDALGFNVEGYYGQQGRYPPSLAPSIFVCTIEKANSLLNHLCEDGRQGDVRCVVVDELHMVGDARRGVVLELLLTKVRLAAPQAQLVGMSATVPNLQQLADWLGATCYVGTFRPVPLQEHIVCRGVVTRREEVGDRTNPRNLPPGDDHQAVMLLLTEVPQCSSLVFCATRQQCVDYARQIIRGLQRLGLAAQRPGCQQLLAELRGLGHESEALAEVIPFGVAFHHGSLSMEERDVVEKGYRARLITILCCTSTLAAGVNLPARRVIFKTPYIGREFLQKNMYMQMCGRAGRAGLDSTGESYLILDPRDFAQGLRLVQEPLPPVHSGLFGEPRGFDRALIECLGAGVLRSMNSAKAWTKALLASHTQQTVPRERLAEAAAVVMRSPLFQVPLSQQGIDVTPNGTVRCRRRPPARKRERSPEDGPEVVIVSQESVVGLRQASCDELAAVVPVNDEPLLSSAADEARFTNTITPVELLVEGAVVTLERDGFIAVSVEGGGADGAERPYTLQLTPFGASTVRGCLALDDALMLRDELHWMQEHGVILSDDLHLGYVTTPLRDCVPCDWERFREALSRLGDNRQRVAKLVGLDEAYVHQRAMGLGSPAPTADHAERTRRKAFVCQRFFTALCLSDMLNEVPSATIERRYGLGGAQQHTLLRSASIFSASMVAFSNTMGWFNLEALLSSFVKRLGFGVKPDILPLVEINGVSPAKARALWAAGYKSATAIAAATPAELFKRVKELNPKDSKAAKFFSLRSAVVVIREANVILQKQMREKRTELVEMELRARVRPSTSVSVHRTTAE